ncbi:hypothetical protein OROMI_020407 [Orobanche minor]
MAGTAVTQAPLPGLVSTSGGGESLSNGTKPLDVNDLRIAMVIDRLTLHVRGQLKCDPLEFCNLCFSLARGIDLSISNHEFPRSAQELPSLAKQVCQCKSDTFLRAAIMVLMISVKSACQSGWFADKDSEELQNLSKEILDGFGSASSFSEEPRCSHSVISTVMSRFYPRMKMGHVFVFLEVKPGFEAYLSDFEIPQNLKTTFPDDRIMLFVVRTDSIETSSCLVSPAKVNFLLNGKGVERRTNLFLDNGPQIPTVVSDLLKYGPNLFQAVGEFNGVAIMSKMPNPDSNVLQDYEQHSPSNVDSDSDLIEGPSRISLNCPISFQRIKTPVKGHSCKHIQCFDFDNYLSINSRRPSWRCPHCNQPVCFTDLRFDRKLAEVLKEAEPNVTDIIISSDGSWNAVMDSDDANQKPESPQIENLLDLTRTDDIMDFVISTNVEDRKLTTNISQNQSAARTISIASHIANTVNDANQTNAHIEDDFWSGIVFPNSQLNEQSANDFSNRVGIASPPVLTDSFTTNGQVEDFSGNNTVFGTSVPQREPSMLNTLQMQQYQYGNANFTAEYGSVPCLPRNVTRIPTAVQALPAQPSASMLQQRCRSRLATMQGSSGAPVVSSSAIRPNSHQISHTFSSPLHQYSGIQVMNAQRVLNERVNQQIANLRIPRTTSQPLGPTQSPMQPSTDFFQTQHSPMAAASYSSNRIVFPTLSVAAEQLNNTRLTSPPPLMSTQAHDQNWRPAGRMRGALSGQAYVDAYSRFISQNQPNQLLNFPSGRPGGIPGGSGVLPNGT